MSNCESYGWTDSAKHMTNSALLGQKKLMHWVKSIILIFAMRIVIVEKKEHGIYTFFILTNTWRAY